MVSDRVFIFYIYTPWAKTLSLVPKSRSSFKVNCQDHCLKKKGCCGGIGVSQTHLVICELHYSLLCVSFTLFQHTGEDRCEPGFCWLYTES